MTDAVRESLQHALGQAYVLERELGGAGMSRVFVARDVALDRNVVVKVLSRESTAGVSGDRFRREIQVIARLQHPHVMSILSAGVADGDLYYVMPFIGGETLRARLAREGPMAIGDASRVLREVLDALAFAHKHGVIHRDIKPENVLVEAGHAVVADFGIAKALRESGTMTSAGVALGTPAYMAPEQATADPSADHRADLYSVGVLAYELLTGTPPFTGNTQQLITAHIATPAPPLRERRSDVPEPLASLVACALAKDPAERPQSADEMIAALDAAVTPGGTAAATASVRPVVPVRRAGRSLRPVAFGAVTLALVLVAAGAWWRSASASRPVVAEGADIIAVMPLGAVSDTSLARLGQDLAVTLSTNLDGVGSLRTVDAVTLLMRARKLPAPTPLADAQGLARELGALSVLSGTLIHEGSNVRATVTLTPVSGSEVLARATAIAPPGQIDLLTDSLTWAVLQQVWRKGTPPSPVLTGLTTKSMDALRAFLDGERAFQRLDTPSALASYQRALELDTMFAQAYLRHDYVNSWSLNPVDERIRSRLLSLVDRLPERERLWVETRGLGLPVPEKVAKWKAAAQRFPDYPPLLMSAADLIIHSGPIYGIPISEARPILERLDQLVPDHGDTKFHMAMVAMVVGTPHEFVDAAEAVAQLTNGVWATGFRLDAAIVRARLEGKPLPTPDSMFALARSIVEDARKNPVAAFIAGSLGMGDSDIGYRLDALDSVRKAGIYQGDLLRASTFGEGLSRISRGEWDAGLDALQRTEGSSLPMSARITSARMAALGAWLGTLGGASADSILRRVRALRGAEDVTADRIELAWVDGVIGNALGDEPRVRSVVSRLRADRAPLAATAARSLDALWRYRTNEQEGADSLRAISDDVMHSGGSFLAMEALDRLLVARALRKRGQPADVERYLMWPDAAPNLPRSISVTIAMTPLVAYERGVALEEAGQREAAAYQYRRVLRTLDKPPEGLRYVLDDAKARLAKLEQTDTPAAKTVK